MIADNLVMKLIKLLPCMALEPPLCKRKEIDAYSCSKKKKRPTQKDASEEIREQLNYEASKTLMSVYGLSLSAYFPVLVILELIVVLGFVLPICELLSTGYIGVLSLTLWPGSVSISSWIVECAFFGAFVHSFFNILDRVPRKDIQPNFYLNILIRYIISVALAMLFYLVFDLFGVNPSNNAIPMALLAGIAFIIGMFPNIFLREIETAISRRINVTLSSDVPLANLPGISRMEASRLWEEGMHNISQLADSDVAELHKRTHFDCTRLSTIIGSAILWRVIGGDKSVQQTGSKQSNSKPDKKKTTASAASEENETKKPTESTSASGESTPAKTQKGETRVEILRSLGINTLQDLYWFVFEKQAPSESVLAGDKRLELLTSSLGLEKEFVINAAKSFVRFQGQLEVPPSAVETVVMSR